jgi:Uma2 family endonuclease
MSKMSLTHFAASQLLAMPHGRQRSELVRGELRPLRPAGWLHGAIAGRVHSCLGVDVILHGLGEVLAAETGCLLECDPDTVRAADVAFVGREHIAGVEAARGHLPGAPDLVVEVLSPSDHPAQVREKVVGWIAAGCRLVWIIDPARRRGEVVLPGSELRRSEVLLP